MAPAPGARPTCPLATPPPPDLAALRHRNAQVASTVNPGSHRRWFANKPGKQHLAACQCQPEQVDLGELESYQPAYEELCRLVERCPAQSAFRVGFRSHAECVETLALQTSCVAKPSMGPRLEVEGYELAVVPPLKLEDVEACAGWLRGASCQVIEGRPASSAESDACGHLIPMDARGGLVVFGRFRGLDQRCDNAFCAEGLYCAFSQPADGGRTCSVCKPDHHEGETCGAALHGWCADGLFCKSSTTDGGLSRCAPHLADGEPCQEHSHCASSFCNPNTKICDPGGHADEGCGTDGDCRVDHCDQATRRCGWLLSEGCVSSGCRVGVCISGVCSQPLPLGHACSVGTDCVSGYCDFENHACAIPCSRNGDCAASEFCPGSRVCSLSGACVGGCKPKRPDGAACSLDAECQSGKCKESSVCGRAAVLGEACSGAEDCDRRRAYCGSAVCKAYVPPGADCVEADSCLWPFRCLEGRCERLDLACQPGVVGDVCMKSACEPGAYCERASQRCERRKPQGAICAESGECGEGMYCKSGACAEYAVAGQDCSQRKCASGTYCDATVQPPQCSEPKADGEPCESSLDCRSDVCASVGTTKVCGGEACVMPPPG